jgi:hypothetical protein
MHSGGRRVPRAIALHRTTSRLNKGMLTNKRNPSEASLEQIPTVEEHLVQLRRIEDSYGWSMAEVYDSAETLDQKKAKAKINLDQFARALEAWHMKALELAHARRSRIDLTSHAFESPAVN